MTATEKPLFKLTNTRKGAFYTLTKWVHDEKNIYGEMKRWSKRGTVWVSGIYTDSVPSSFTLKVEEYNPFEILGENIERFDDTEFWKNREPGAPDVYVKQRRAGDGYPDVDPDTHDECEMVLKYGGHREDDHAVRGWKKVGFRVGIAFGNVKVERVSDVRE